MSDFVLILSLLSCWLFNNSALFLGVASEKTKTIASSWFHGKLNFSEKSNFSPLLWQLLICKKWYSSHNFFWRHWRYCLENQPYLDVFLWSLFRSLLFTSVFLLIQMILPLYFTHVWICLNLFFALLLAIWWFRFGFGSCKWKDKLNSVQLVSWEVELFWTI